jgi:glycerophosphoryl diester phosphodiesterase
MIKLFAHRGYLTENQRKTANFEKIENSIISLKQAFDRGFTAIEFDIWYYRQELLLKHNQPEDNEINDLAKFSNYFDYNINDKDNKISYWCDFKNINLDNLKTILEKAKKILQKQEINLNNCYFAPFITDYQLASDVYQKFIEFFSDKINFVALCENLNNINDINILGDFLNKNNIKFLSINHNLINQELIKKLPNNINLMAWTVNDIARINHLNSLGVCYFATDIITPQMIR